MASFHHASVTKGIMLAVGAISLACSMFDIKHYLQLQLVPHISRDLQYWRLFTYQLACTSSGELLLIELLIFNIASTIERRFGSIKFASFLAVSATFSATISFAALLLLNNMGLNQVPSGPFAIAFALLDQYYSLIPSAYAFRVFSVTFSSKTYVLPIALQLVFSSYPGSVIAASIGIMTSRLYRLDLLASKTYRLPPVAINFGRRFLMPSIGSTRPSQRTNRAIPEPSIDQVAASSSMGDGSEGTAQLPTEADPTSLQGRGTSVVREWVNQLTGREAGLRQPSREEVDEIVRMFPSVARQTIIIALQRSPTTEAAVDTLLNTTYPNEVT